MSFRPESASIFQKTMGRLEDFPTEGLILTHAPHLHLIMATTSVRDEAWRCQRLAWIAT